MIEPTRICTSSTPATTRKYFHSAFWLGVGARNFSSTGSKVSFGALGSIHRRKITRIAPMAKNTMVNEAQVQVNVAGVGLLPTSGSDGQLLVHEKSLPGRRATV